MNDIIFEPNELYKAYQTSKGETVPDGRCRVRTLRFESRWTEFLLPDDRAIPENRSFPYVMIEPLDLAPEGSEDVLAVTHGLNEGSPAKLFPWAYNLCLALRMPALIFPMAFHVGRRSADWGFSAQARLVSESSALPGNFKTSPFNARISLRLAQAPERFFGGGLQSFYDTLDLRDRIASGFHPGRRPGARMHFLGYSAGGYLALTLLMADPEQRFCDSRAVLFASCAPADGMHPGSIFIMDTDAADRLAGFLKNHALADVHLTGKLAQLAQVPLYWIDRIFSGDIAHSDRLTALKDRVMGVANPSDRVITAKGMKRNLTDVSLLSLPLGIHEFPFNLPDPLIEVYDRRQEPTKTLLNRVGDGHRIAEPYRTVFEAFIRETSAFIDGQKHA
ncbi:MAG: hypothetical protein FJY97_10240 [candidate division Zixibacteria bacterium]|nr:hypothetical protein [candidate division Zixibacteria bacterium]